MIEYCNLSERHEEQILALYKENFKILYGEVYDPEKVKREIQTYQVVVAEQAGRVLGFGVSTDLASGIGYPGVSELTAMRRSLMWAKGTTEKKAKFKTFYEQKAKKQGGKAVTRHYNNKFLRETTEVHPEDFYFSAVAVDKKFQNMGIATEITRRRIEIARQSGATAIFADTRIKSASKHIFQKFRFSLMLLRGPTGDNNEASLLMGKRLRKK
ncbi:GNAT family N-acetyltransferase [Candidatus Gracilibacteria bacterium]|nr:GNAT family N-acetyltransferase [Candidatus Gracilibacteria bacterium]